MDDAWEDIVNMPGIPNALKKKVKQRQRRKQYVAHRCWHTPCTPCRARVRAALGGQQAMPAEASALLGEANVNYITQRCVYPVTLCGACILSHCVYPVTLCQSYNVPPAAHALRPPSPDTWCRYDEAISQLMDVITLVPNIPGPYNTLGAIYEQQGKKDKALDCYMIAAHLNKLVRVLGRPVVYNKAIDARRELNDVHVNSLAQDAPAWRRMAELSKELGLTEQAVYCLTKVIRADKDALDARFERAALFAELGNLREVVG